jgi:hypothetical protein
LFAGGVGKSTLATAIYNNLLPTWQLKYSVHDSAIVQLVDSADGRNKDPVECLNVILRQLGRPLAVNGMPAKDTNLVPNRKLLLLLDDAWDRQHLEALVDALKGRDTGSIMIVTSRKHSILSVALGQASHLHEVVGVTDEAAQKQILCGYAGMSTEQLEQLPSAAKQHLGSILQLCKGFPLALRVVGGYIKIQWDDPMQEECWQVSVFFLGKWIPAAK